MRSRARDRARPCAPGSWSTQKRRGRSGEDLLHPLHHPRGGRRAAALLGPVAGREETSGAHHRHLPRRPGAAAPGLRGRRASAWPSSRTASWSGARTGRLSVGPGARHGDLAGRRGARRGQVRTRGGAGALGPERLGGAAPADAPGHQLLRLSPPAVRLRPAPRGHHRELLLQAAGLPALASDLPRRPARDLPGVLRQAQPLARPRAGLREHQAHRPGLLQEGLRDRSPLPDHVREPHDDRAGAATTRRRPSRP